MDEQDLKSDFSVLNEWIQNHLAALGISEGWIVYVKLVLLVAIVVIGMYILQLVVNKVLTFLFRKLTKTTNLHIFQYAINNRLPHFLALVIPYSFIRASIPFVFEDFRSWIIPSLKITDIYMVFMVIWTLMAIVKSLADVVQEKEAFRNKPFKSYLQVVQIIFYIFGAVALFSILTGKSVTAIFAAMGAASAVLMLMFQDSIKGFVGSIQLSGNDMVRIGDWITMNKYGADGNVTEINLTTVKIVNFDKTVTTIPTYALISDSFQNWRGMQDSGGRRIKKSLYINQADIVFMTDEELERMKQIDALKDFITDKQSEIEKIKDKSQNEYFVLNSNRVTNNDLFIRYATSYLQAHPYISKKMTLMVRTLAPTTEGLPVELYSFTNTVVWGEYENITTEIMNHLIGSLKYFNLRIFTTTASDPYDININNIHPKSN